MAAPVPGRCGFFVEKKKRFCKMIVARGNRFCGEHGHMEEGSCKRIACPLDPKHTVCEDKLDKHLKKCNSRQKPKPAYYVDDINAGSADGDETPQVSLSECSRSHLESLVDKLKTLTAELESELEDSFLSHPVFQEELNNPKNGDSAHKHLRQQSSILANLEALGLLARSRCFVEFGAGRGKLSHWIHEALKGREASAAAGGAEAPEPLQLLLVERCSTRFKVDGKQQDGGVELRRLQVDIQHLDLRKVQLLERQLPLVGVGKHLCGAATDLALRCLLETRELPDEPPRKRLKPSAAAAAAPPEGPDLDPGRSPVLGLAVALCCHHRCDWRHYVGRRFFEQKNLGAAEFSAFCRMSSWATCGARPADQRREDGVEEEHEPAKETDAVNSFLSPSERRHVGRLCKLLIDRGRLDFLRGRGFDGRLRRYVDSKVTLENVLLTAVPSSDLKPVPL